MSSPHIVLVHGAWHSQRTWDNLRSVLTTRGFQSTTVALPSTGASIPHEDQKQDVAAVRDVILPLINKGLDVILVLHSYGGLPGSTASEDLLKRDRLAEGKSGGGIIHVIYVGSLLIPPGRALFDPSKPPPAFIDFTTAPGFTILPDEWAYKLMYNGTPRELAAKHVEDLRPQSVGSFAGVAGFAPWQYGKVGCTYVVAEQDVVVTPEASERMFELEGWMGRVVRLKGNHCLYIEEAEAVADVIGDVAKLE